MTNTPLPIGEDDLQAYVDDRLSEVRRSEVDAYLADHPELAARLAEDRDQRETLRRQLAGKFAEPIASRLRVANVRLSRRHKRGVWLRNGIAAAFLLTLGGGVGWIARGTVPFEMPLTVAVTRDAVAAYRTFVVEVNHPVEVRASDEAHLVQWLSKRLGRPLPVPDLSRFGFRLMGGRVLPAASEAAAMLMYDDDNGTRLTVYVRAGATGQTAFRFWKDGDVSTFAWLDQGYGFAVSAASDRNRLFQIAEAVYKTLDGGVSLPRREG